MDNNSEINKSYVVHRFKLSINSWAALCLALHIVSLKTHRVHTVATMISYILSHPRKPLDFCQFAHVEQYADASSVLGSIPIAIRVDITTNDKIRDVRNRLRREGQRPVSTAQILRLIFHAATDL